MTRASLAVLSAEKGRPFALFVEAGTPQHFTLIMPRHVPAVIEPFTVQRGEQGLVKSGKLVEGPTLRVDAATGAIETFTAHPETGCAVAATERHLVIAGGADGGAVSGAVEIDDATTLQPVATATLAVPRTGATAIALPNDQVLIIGGADGASAPIEALELFTPDVP